MLIKKKVSANGEFAKVGVDIKDGDVVTILDGGTITSGEFGDRHTFGIKTAKGDKIISFNQTSLNNLVDAFGDDSEDWVNKKVKVFLVKQMVSGTLRNIAYFAGEDWEMTDKGFRQTSVLDDIPVIEPDDIKLEDIPFNNS